MVAFIVHSKSPHYSTSPDIGKTFPNCVKFFTASSFHRDVSPTSRFAGPIGRRALSTTRKALRHCRFIRRAVSFGLDMARESSPSRLPLANEAGDGRLSSVGLECRSDHAPPNHLIDPRHLELALPTTMHRGVHSLPWSSRQ